MTLSFRSPRVACGLLALLAALVFALASAGTAHAASNLLITTVAGGGGDMGDGGPATGASLFTPYGVAVDAHGDLFIADAYNYRVRKVTPDGTITTVAGDGTEGSSGDGGPATSAQLDDPTGVAVDAHGNVFIADMWNNHIREVHAATGIITSLVGQWGAFGFYGDGGPASSAGLDSPMGVAVDSSGNLFIADTNNNRIREVNTATGIITTVAGSGPGGGSGGFSGDGGAATSAGLNEPTAVAVDASGNLFIADTNNNRIREVDAATGIITTVAGTGTAGSAGDDGPATSAELNGPTGVAVDPDGNLFIGDSGNNSIREVDAVTGIITTVAGTGTAGSAGDGGPATSAELAKPHGLAFNPDGNLFIAEDSGDVRELVPPPAAVSVDQASKDFGSVVVGNGSSSTRETFTVTNTGGSPLNITNASLGGQNPGQFAIAADGCSGQTVAAGGTCTIDVQYQPTAVGQQTAELDISSNASNSLAPVTLTGTGTPAITADGSLSFGGEVAVGDGVSTSVHFAQEYSGTATYVSSTSTNPDFSARDADGSCTPISQGQCSLEFVFTPSERGAESGVVTVTFSLAGLPYSVDVPVSGTGVLPGNVTPDHSSQDFGSVTVGHSSDTATFTIADTGDQPVPLTAVALGGPNADQFAIVSDSCQTQPPGRGQFGLIPANGTCTVVVQFKPTATGAQTAMLGIIPFLSTSSLPVTSIQLSGTGVTPAALSVASAKDFGSVTVGQASGAATLTATNTGGSPLSIAKATLGGPNADQFSIVPGTDKCSDQTVAPGGGTCTVRVRFSPTASGTQTAELDITQVGSTTPTVVKLSGVGAAASQSTQPIQPTPPASQPPHPKPPTHPKAPPKLVQRMSSVGHPSARRLLAHGEKVRVYCNRGCTLNVGLRADYRAAARGKKAQWKQVTAGHRAVKLTHAGYKTITVKLAAHRRQLKHAGSVLLGVYVHNRRTLVGKRWMLVKGPKAKAKVRALNRRR